MGKKRTRGQLTQDQIWDDSALLRSWQDALDEYQFYHSIHTKGENVDDILRQAEAEDNTGNEGTGRARSFVDHAPLSNDMEDGEVNEQDNVGFDEQAAEPSDESLPVHPSNLQHSVDRNTTDASASLDQCQILENIKMAYWWAGYYSGLYDAKRTGT